MTNDVGITFNADSFKQFNKTLSDFEKITKNVDGRLEKLGKQIISVDSLVNTLSNSFATYSNIVVKLDGGAIKKIVESLDSITSASFSRQKIDEFASGFSSLIRAFTSVNARPGFFKSIINNLRGIKSAPETIKVLLSGLNAFDVSKVNEFSTGIRRLVLSFNDLQKISVPSAKIQDFVEGFKTLVRGFTEISGKSRFFGGLGEIYRQFTGKQSLFELLKKLDFSALEKVGSFSGSVKNLSKFFSEITSIRIDEAAIKSFANALRTLIKELTKNTGFKNLFGGLFGNNSFFSQIENVGKVNLSSFNTLTTAVSRIVNSVDKINRIKVDPTKTRQIVQQFSDLARIAAQSFQRGNSETFVKQFLDLGVDAATGLVRGFKRLLGIASPSRVFIEFGKNTVQGFAKGVQGALGLAKSAFNGIVKAAKTIVSPITGIFNFIKNRFVLTFADIERIAKSTFRAVIGTTIEFESAFTGVLKTLDTSQIFAQSGEEGVSAFIDQLRADLIGLSRDSDSMVAGLENSFVRLSSIAEAAGQLGVAAEDIVGFTDVIGQLSIATDLADEEAAFFLAKFTSITGDQSVDNFQRLGGTIVNLGNNLAVTESQIAEVAQRIVASGTSAGLSQDQILAWSAAIRASGVNAEAGSTAFIQFGNAVTEAIASDDLDEIEQFSELIGLTGEEFAKLFDEDPNQVFINLLESMGKLNRTELVRLEEQLGLDGIRLDQFVASLGAAQANSQVLTRAMALASDGMEEFGATTEDFNALQEETNRRTETTEFAVNRMKNAWLSLSNTIGTVVQPVFNAIISTITDIILGIEGFISKASNLGVFADALGINTEELNTQRAINDELEQRIDIFGRISETLDSSATTTAGFIEHQFEVGDTLSALAEEYGITVQDILDFNDMALEDFLGNVSSVRIPTQIPIEIVDAQNRQPIDANFLQSVGASVSGITQQQQEEIRQQRILNAELGAQQDLINGIFNTTEANLSTTTGFIEHQFDVGDTISGLADKYGITVQDILDFNNATLEDFLGNISSVRIPIQTVDADTNQAFNLSDFGPQLTSGITESVSGIGDALSGAFGSAFAEANVPTPEEEKTGPEAALQRIKDSLDEASSSLGDFGTGLQQIITGDITGGLTTISNAFKDIKDNVRDAFETFLNAKGIDTEGLDFAQILIQSFDQLFGVDLTPVYEFVKNHYIDILSAGFALLTGSSITFAIPVARILFDALGDNFGSADAESGGFITRINSFVGEVGGIISDAFSNIGTIISRQNQGPIGEFGGPQLVSGAVDEEGLIGPIIQVIANSAGRLASALGTLLLDAFVELAKNLPSLISEFGRLVIVPFIEGIGDDFKDINNLRDLADAMLSGLQTAIGLVFGIGLVTSLLGGGGIVASIGSGLTALFSAAMFLINPVTLLAGATALFVGLLTSGEFKDKVVSAFDDILQDIFGEDWRTRFEEGVRNFIEPIGIWIANAINDIKTFFSIALNDIQKVFLDVQIQLLRVLDAINPLGGNEEQRANLQARIDALNAENDNLRLLQDLQKGGAGGVEAFQTLGGNIFGTPEEIIAQAEELGIAPLFAQNLAEDISESFPELFASEIKNTIFTALGDNTITPDEAAQIGDLFAFDPELFSTIFDEQIVPSLDNEIATLRSERRGEAAEEYGLGADVVTGFIEGLQAQTDSEEFNLALQNVATSTESIMRQAFESNSPSQLTARIGDDLMRGLSVGMARQVPILTTITDQVIFQIGRIGNAAFQAHNDIAGLEGALQSLGGINFSVNVSGTGPFPGRQFGGDVMRGSVYEVLEDNLPFELFRNGIGQTFIIPGQNGTIIPPSGVGGGGGGSVSNSFDITVPVTFESVPSDVSDAQLNNIANRIAIGVETRLQDGMRKATLNDRFTRAGTV